jgi:hypothetical protein
MQIQNSSKMYKSMMDCAKYVYRNEGLSAFYVSYPTTLSMTVPFTALQFLAYESISTTMNPKKEYDPITHCLAGAVAGGFAAALTTPMDVIKTMLQTRGSATDPELRTVNGFVAGCRLLFRREGVRGFFKGVGPRVVTTMPSTAICWSAYEASKCVLPTLLIPTRDRVRAWSRISAQLLTYLSGRTLFVKTIAVRAPFYRYFHTATSAANLWYRPAFHKNPSRYCPRRRLDCRGSKSAYLSIQPCRNNGVRHLAAWIF